ncbi:hypothetical protein HPB51_019069 [Rhipicephalus microplus]|uniref:Uncharacterized protein n=1 Tax=Rhipicephalus microplus TaxID=6941 RepID=A0A9J6D6T9_RHIMP|nr:hypothetical protein HPB51_019069 [Rhipicephalus microplus]
MVMGNGKWPEHAQRVLEFGPKFAVEPQKSRPELLTIVRHVSKEVPDADFDKCESEGMDPVALYRPSGSHQKMVSRPPRHLLTCRPCHYLSERRQGLFDGSAPLQPYLFAIRDAIHASSTIDPAAINSSAATHTASTFKYIAVAVIAATTTYSTAAAKGSPGNSPDAAAQIIYAATSPSSQLGCSASSNCWPSSASVSTGAFVFSADSDSRLASLLNHLMDVMPTTFLPAKEQARFGVGTSGLFQTTSPSAAA